MKQFFASFLGSLIGILVAMVLFVIIIFASIASMVSTGSDKPFYTKKNSILHIKLDHAITERGIKNPFGDLLGSGSSLGLDQVLECFENAKADSSIKGIFLNVADVSAPAATMEEIRNAMIDFKTTGKFIISYSEVYSQKAYYLASIADKIYVNPEGSVELKGLSAQVMFYKNALEKLEIDAQIFRHGKFKSAIEPFDLTKMSEANRLQTMTYVSSLWNHMLQGISKARKISIEELNTLADEIKIETAKDAETYKLVDGLKYEDEIIAMMMEKSGVTDIKKLNYVELKDYVRAPKKEKENEEDSKFKIAVIYANGSIESGEGDDETIGSERIAKAIREARLDSSIKAIVLRVNSPGGSALASDVMWRETVLAKKAKPFVVSMGDYAASGGYYIACAADVIVAQPNTITGSIGVFGVLPNAQAFLNNKLGITLDTVNTNKHSDMGAFYRPVKPQEAASVQRIVEQVYTSFITKVAEGRKMTTAQVDSIGQGRVWSGVDAQKIGLVDELGGLELAIRIAAERAKIEEYRVVPMPKTKDPLEGLFGGMGAQVKEDMVKEQLGVHYIHFKHMKSMLNIKGIQARLPYDVVLY